MDDFAHIVGEDVHFRGRSPSGERGLKFVAIVRGHEGTVRRSPSGERGLKSRGEALHADLPSRSPSGERGLK